MKKGPHKHEDEEIVLDAESGEEIVAEESDLSANQLKHKLKVLREELKQTQKERDENLAGWQRAKADLVNFRRMVDEDKARDAARAKGALARAVIPGLDSFESGMTGQHWDDLNAEWRDGITSIYSQMLKGLAKEGFEAFGVVGDAFDPTFHECLSVVPPDEKHPEGTIVQVVQRGYSLGDEVIRPAKVIVAQSH